jgi:hypothetical protein
MPPFSGMIADKRLPVGMQGYILQGMAIRPAEASCFHGVPILLRSAYI